MPGKLSVLRLRTDSCNSAQITLFSKRLSVGPGTATPADRQQPRVGTDRLRTRPGNDGFLWEKIERKLIDSLFQHHAASVRFKPALSNQTGTPEDRFFKSSTNNPG
ncbi:MAG: hypothetical protein ACYC26_11965 [Phycisphaerales bacterium]